MTGNGDCYVMVAQSWLAVAELARQGRDKSPAKGLPDKNAQARP